MAELGYDAETAERLIKTHSCIVSAGIMEGNFALRATAIALELADSYKGEVRYDAC